MKKMQWRLGVLLFLAFDVSLQLSGQTFLEDGLVGYYPFNGNANDESFNHNNANAVGATLVADRFGRENSAYALNGADQYLQALPQDYLNFANGEFTISVWALMNTPERPCVFLGKDVGGGNQPKWFFFYGGINAQLPENHVALHLNPPPTYEAPARWDAPKGTWHNYMVRKSGTNYTSFIDGVVVGTSVGPASLPSGITAPLIIGQAEGAGWLNGRIDDIRIYNRPLSDNEVGNLFAFESSSVRLLLEVASVRLKWLSEAGVNYEIQWSTKFQDWTPLKTLLGTGEMMTFIDDVGGDKRFYRLIKK